MFRILLLTIFSLLLIPNHMFATRVIEVPVLASLDQVTPLAIPGIPGSDKINTYCSQRSVITFNNLQSTPQTITVIAKKGSHFTCGYYSVVGAHATTPHRNFSTDTSIGTLVVPANGFSALEISIACGSGGMSMNSFYTVFTNPVPTTTPAAMIEAYPATTPSLAIAFNNVISYVISIAESIGSLVAKHEWITMCPGTPPVEVNHQIASSESLINGGRPF